MVGTGLEVRLRQGRDRAELSQFTRTLDAIRLSLIEIDGVHLVRGSRATWVVDDISHVRDDLVVRLRSRYKVTKDRDAEDMLVPVQALLNGAEVLHERPTVPDLFAPKTVRRLAKIATPTLGVQEVSLALYNGKVGDRVELDNAVRDNATAAVKPIAFSYGSITGKLCELKSAERGGGVRVIVRDGNHAIAGHVRRDGAEQLRELWNHRVMLGGIIRRNSTGQALRIDVDHMEAMPDTNAGRTPPSELLGAYAGTLTDKQIDERLDRMRRGEG
ncbi:hypothetical protein [Mycolicibacterium parafortuitum]|uniref:hypothetical protein n=1 Tax=Mycolicibacterium parafortuitum TaxID=39692 RepID=UPI0032C42A64